MILVFAPVVVARPREKESPIRGKENPIKEKEKETREGGDRTVADHQGQKEVSAPEALRPHVTCSRPLKSAATRGVIMRWIRLILPDPLDETVLSVVRTNLMVKLYVKRLPLLPQHPFVLAEAKKTHRGAVACHGNFPRESLSFH